MCLKMEALSPLVAATASYTARGKGDIILRPRK
jgi:hypothetical protein